MVLLAVTTFADEPSTDTVRFGLRFVVDDNLAITIPRRQLISTALAEFVGEVNGYYQSSHVVLRAEIVDMRFAHFASDDVMMLLSDMEHERNAFKGMFRCAEDTGADYTIAVSSRLMIRGKRGCGRGFAVNSTPAQIASSRRAFAVIDFACGAHSLAHELGHLMGLNHGALVDQCQPGMGHRNAIAPYANGYAVGPCNGRPDTGKFGTIMVGGWMRAIAGERNSLPLFSNPRLRDSRCGVSGVCGDPGIGDEARALNENARIYAAHAEPGARRFAIGACP